jgi:hypothetical protein
MSNSFSECCTKPACVYPSSSSGGGSGGGGGMFCKFHPFVPI